MLPEEAWEKAAREFQSAWSRIADVEGGDRPRWEMRESKAGTLRTKTTYLCLERVPVATDSPLDPDQAEEEVDSSPDQGLWECRPDEEVEDGVVDAAGMKPHVYDFHVVYNSSFSVPELFIKGSRWDGSALRFDEVIRDFSRGATGERSEQALCSVFLQKEHPLLLLPWFGFHLCETSGLVAMMLRASGDGAAADPRLSALSNLSFELRYMVSWWSSVGKFVGLGLPLDLIPRSLVG